MNANRVRIEKLQEEMAAAGMDMYLVSTADFTSLSMWEHTLKCGPGCQDSPVPREPWW